MFQSSRPGWRINLDLSEIEPAMRGADQGLASQKSPGADTSAAAPLGEPT